MGGLADELGTTVAIEVVDEELRVVGPGTDVLSQVDTPELGAVELVGIEVDIARLATDGVILKVGGLPADYQFVVAVAVEVGHRPVVGEIVVAGLRGRTVEPDVLIDITPPRHGGRSLDDLTILLHHYLILAVVRAARRADVADGQVALHDLAIA